MFWGVRAKEREEERFGVGEFVVGKEERRGRRKGKGKGEFVLGKEGERVGGKGPGTFKGVVVEQFLIIKSLLQIGVRANGRCIYS